MAMTTRPTQNQVRALSPERVMMGLLRRDMDSPRSPIGTEPSLLALLTPQGPRSLAHQRSTGQHRLCVIESWRSIGQGNCLHHHQSRVFGEARVGGPRVSLSSRTVWPSILRRPVLARRRHRSTAQRWRLSDLKQMFPSSSSFMSSRPSLACVIRCKLTDCRPVELVAAVSEQSEEPVPQQARKRQGHTQFFGGS